MVEQVVVLNRICWWRFAVMMPHYTYTQMKKCVYVAFLVDFDLPVAVPSPSGSRQHDQRIIVVAL